MKEYPLFLTDKMVFMTRLDFKTETRRPVRRIRGFGLVTEFGPSSTPGYDWTFRDRQMRWHDLRHDNLMSRCPYGVPGDRLWVREAWQNRWGDEFNYQERQPDILYRADDDSVGGPWHPSIHMPRWACRYLLDVVSVRLEQLQDITLDSALAEGCEPRLLPHGVETSLEGFPFFWNFYSKPAPGQRFEDNPWVWAIKYHRVGAP